jgi:hypothetical protein
VNKDTVLNVTDVVNILGVIVLFGTFEREDGKKCFGFMFEKDGKRYGDYQIGEGANVLVSEATETINILNKSS